MAQKINKSLFWLASYPKSGNTWLRAFLANYVFNQNEPIPVNQLHKLGMGDAITDAYRKTVTPHFNPENPIETANLRPAFFNKLVGNDADINLVKTHNQKTLAFGVELIPDALTRGAIYIVRDPRDMVISYASHHGLTLDRAIHGLNNVDNATAGNERNVHQFLGRWSDHVNSWTRTKKFPVLTIRYEDMLRDPEKTFSSVIRRIGMSIEKPRLLRSIDFASFKSLKQQEDQSGFVENSTNQERFFRKGSSGQYLSELSNTQIQRIETDHEKIMRRHGYLR